jgi:arylsulfatase A-like enzyme
MYGDFVEMVDAEVGRLLQHLAELGLEENTLVIFTSDNGPYWRPEHIAETGHRAAGPLRGMKGDIWEGGHRVPFLARWPEQIPAGSRSDALISLTDGFATVAGALGLPIPAGQAEDSHNQWPVFTGAAGAVERQQMVHHSSKAIFALRAGPWKYIPHWGSAGFTPEAASAPAAGPAGQLYNLRSDLAETDNQWEAMPDSIAAFEARLAEEQR